MIKPKTEDIDFEIGTMTGGIKTAAVKQRLVPIHSKILHIVQNRAEQSKSVYLFESGEKKVKPDAI